ncbi:MAG: Type-2 restriction enzyme BanI [Phycisphaerae bacterium]|nr:Type-2 restriction enzyme BanI [Phycisphaerae bacterium]
MPHRKFDDLEAHAAKFWPTALAQQEQTTSSIPKLIESQEKFIGILYVADASPIAWKDALATTQGVPGNLFLMHLMVLSDLGGEKLDRYRTNVDSLFPSKKMAFRWKDADHDYRFKSLDTCRRWTNEALCVDGQGLVHPEPLSDAMEDVAMLLLHGGSSVDPDLPGELLKKCVLGKLIGRKPELDSFVRQRYIYVSRITSGGTANAMGQLCQKYVKERLQATLREWAFSRHTIPGISQNAGRTDMSFDLVAESPTGKYCAIEISFQETTNSTIERKAGQAHARQRVLHRAGHKIAYVIDGAGNFQRKSAISTICRYSDCTVTLRNQELDALAAFLKKM